MRGRLFLLALSISGLLVVAGFALLETVGKYVLFPGYLVMLPLLVFLDSGAHGEGWFPGLMVGSNLAFYVLLFYWVLLLLSERRTRTVTE
jgi:hypothetical protein